MKVSTIPHIFRSYLLILVWISFTNSKNITTASPTWLTSPYFRAGNDKVIKSLTGNSSKPIYTFTFSSSLSGVPNLAYGIKGYQRNWYFDLASDWMGQQLFEIRRQNLTASTFTVSMQIFGVTNIRILNVPYIAIDPLFPHHLNSFDNVPLNYGGQTLVNVTSQVVPQTYFTSYINYTAQSASSKFKTFTSPLSSNKILLFMSSIFIRATFRTTVYYPISLVMTTALLNNTHYSWTLTLSTMVLIEAMHFSQIIFNYDDVLSSKKYELVHEVWEVDGLGGFKAIPSQFVDNFIMGLTDFKAIDGYCAFQYFWEYQTKNGVFGVDIKPSLPDFGDCGFSLQKSTILYIKTWQCNYPHLYFNLTINLCQNLCTDRYYENATDNSCSPCYINCLTCQSNGVNSCLSCFSNRILNALNQCECQLGYYETDTFNCSKCYPIVGCLSCLNVTHCKICDYNSGYIVNQSFRCACLTGYYNLPNSSYCYKCTKIGCISCNATQCLQCNQSIGYIVESGGCKCIAGYYRPSNTLECVLCPSLIGCTTCNNLTTCLLCGNGYILNDKGICQCANDYYRQKVTSNCFACPQLPFCKYCFNSTTCKQCINGQQYRFNNNTHQCMDITVFIIVSKLALSLVLISALLALVLKNSLPTAQLISAIQLCYLSMGTNPNLHPYLLSLTDILKPIFGINYDFLSINIPNSIHQQHILNLHYQTSFLHNINVMLLIEMIMVIGYVLMVVEYGDWWVVRIIRKQLILLVIFNSLNICFSVPLINGSYVVQVFGVMVGLAILVGQIVHVLFSEQKYDGFEQTFKAQVNEKTYILHWVVGRILPCMCIALFRAYPSSISFLILMIQLMLVIVFYHYSPYLHLPSTACVAAGEMLVVIFMCINIVNSVGSLDAPISSIIQIIIIIILAILALVSSIASLLLWFKSNNRVVNDMKSTARQISKHLDTEQNVADQIHQ